VSDLEKSITTGWYEVRTRLDKPDDLFDYLEIDKQDLYIVAEGLRLSVEQGVVEYKRSLLHSVMSRLGTLKYDSKAITDLSEQCKKGAYLTFLPILERLFVWGMLRVPSAEPQEPEESERNRARQAPKQAPDLKTIVNEVRNRVRENSELQNNPEIKRIFMQLKYYNSELEKKKSLEANIPKEKRASLEANFQQIFTEIHEKIQNAFLSYLKQEEQNSRPTSRVPILKRYDFTKCEGTYRKQAEEASKLYHTLHFARKERYQMREILLQISTAEPYYEDSYKKELECYGKIAPFAGDTARVGLALGENIRRYCERSVEWRTK